LPYHGLGSGIKRALEGWSDIDFIDDREGCIFTAILHRKEIKGTAEVIELPESSGKSSGKTEDQVLKLLSDRPKMTIPDLSKALGITTRGVEKQVSKLRARGHLRHIGPATGGHWEVVRKDEG
jgi:ATP-dependent DNA helicase RecG